MRAQKQNEKTETQGENRERERERRAAFLPPYSLISKEKNEMRLFPLFHTLHSFYFGGTYWTRTNDPHVVDVML